MKSMMDNFQTCTTCNRLLSFKNFYKDNRTGRLRTQCKDCCKNYDKQYYKNHKEEKRIYAQKPERKLYAREYNSKEYVKQRRKETDKQEENIIRRKEKDRKYYLKKKQEDKYKLEQSMCVLISAILSERTKHSDTLKERCNYTEEDLRQHFENQFTPEMNWDNYGKYWEVDHIIPRASFSYSDIKDEQFKQCWALNNLRPLKVEENRQRPKHKGQ